MFNKYAQLMLNKRLSYLPRPKKTIFSLVRTACSLKAGALPPPPSSYEYALISEASYFDDQHLPTDQDTLKRRIILTDEKKWKCIENIRDDLGYRASLWVNDASKQIVIAHRGSQNIDSWITDAESIAQLKPGHFVEQAIHLLKHENVKKLKAAGYRLSTTGHSLGGFLAQVCVFWAHRSEFQDTYYPNISAVVFDSPGVVDFLHVIRPNPISQHASIPLESLNIHNFCAMPTIVSTYGTQTGTVWHIPSTKQVSLAFVNEHSLSSILSGYDAGTGEPIQFRRMSDWPQANYSAYANVRSALSHVASKAVMLPFDILNALYKNMKSSIGYTYKQTWYDRLLRQHNDQVTQFLQKTGSEGKRYPNLETFQEKLTLSINAHYSTSSNENIKEIDIFHFDQEIQNFLIGLEIARKDENKYFWQHLQNIYSTNGVTLLKSFYLYRKNNVNTIIVNAQSTLSVFGFQTQLLVLLNDKGIVHFESWNNQQIQNLTQILEDMNNKGMLEKKPQKVQEIEQQLEELKKFTQHLAEDKKSIFNSHTEHWPDTSFKIPEKFPEELHALYGVYKADWNHSLLETQVRTLRYYVELNITHQSQQIALSQKIKEFLTNDEERYFLLEGHLGTGKSLAVRFFQKELWRQWQNENDYIPIVIELKNVKNKKISLTEHLKKVCKFTENQIINLGKRFRFIIFLDGLNEYPHSLKQHIIDNSDFHKWPKIKVFFTARTEWLQMQPDYNYSLTKTYGFVIIKCNIEKFSPEQIDDYLQKRFASDKHSWKDYRNVLKQEAELYALVESPVMLRLVCDVLAESGPHLNLLTQLHNRAYLYDQFLSAWFKREITNSPSSPVFFNTSYDKESFLDYMRQLAFEMFRQNIFVIKQEYHMQNGSYERVNLDQQTWTHFFGSDDDKIKRAQKACPLLLTRTDDIKEENKQVRYYEFIHTSFMEHAVANVLWHALKNKNLTESIKDWNHRYITEERGVLMFLTDFLINCLPEQRSKIQDRLLEIIYASREKPENSIAASSAITLLNQGKFNFSTVKDQDLSRIHIPKADLTSALMPFVKLTESDLSEVCFHEAILLAACLDKTILNGTRFLPAVLTSEKEVRTLSVHPRDINTIAYSDGNNLVIASLSEGEKKQYLKEHQEEIRNVSWSSTGQFLASASMDGIVCIWDAQHDYSLVGILKEQNYVQSVTWLSDKCLASGSKNGVRIWDITKMFKNRKNYDGLHSAQNSIGYDNNALVKTFTEVEKSILTLSCWKDEQKNGLLAAGSEDGTIYLWKIEYTSNGLYSMQYVTSFKEAADQTIENEVRSISFSPDGSLLAAGGASKKVCLWNVKNFGKNVQKPEHILEGHTNFIRSVAWSKDGQFLASGGYDHSVRIWNRKHSFQKSASMLSGHTNSVRSISWLNSNYLVSGSDDKTISIWDINRMSRDLSVTTPNKFTKNICSLALRNNILASWNNDNTICIWEIDRNSGLPSRNMPIKFLKEQNNNNDNHQEKRIKSLYWLSNDCLAASSHDDYICIFDINKSTTPIKYFHIKHKISCMTSATDGQYIAAADVANNITIWNVNDTTCKEFLIKQIINCIAWSQDGLLAIGGKDFIQILDLSSSDFKSSIQLTAANHDVKCLAWSNNGLLASGSLESKVMIWDPKKLKEPIATLSNFKNELFTDEVKNIAWVSERSHQWLIVSTADEIFYWNDQNWNEPVLQSSFGTNILSHDNFRLAISFKNSLHVIDIEEFLKKTGIIPQWKIAIGNILWLQNCDLREATMLSSSVMQLLGQEGAIVDKNYLPNTKLHTNTKELVVLEVELDKLYAMHNKNYHHIDIALCLLKIGEKYEELSKLPEAKKHYDKALNHFYNLPRSKENFPYIKELQEKLNAPFFSAKFFQPQDKKQVKNSDNCNGSKPS